jgi:flagellar motor switch protein FliM
MLRQKFDQQWSMRRTQSTEEDQSRMLRLTMLAKMRGDVRLQGPTLNVSDLLELQPGHVLAFDFPVNRPLDLVVNGKVKYQGEVVQSRHKRAFRVNSLYQPLE